MTSSDFSFRLCAFSTLRGRTSKTISGSTTRIAGTHSTRSLSSTARRWFPLGVQYTPGLGEITTIGSTKRSRSEERRVGKEGRSGGSPDGAQNQREGQRADGQQDRS